jgi:hypothetical protein
VTYLQSFQMNAGTLSDTGSSHTCYQPQFTIRCCNPKNTQTLKHPNERRNHASLSENPKFRVNSRLATLITYGRGISQVLLYTCNFFWLVEMLVCFMEHKYSLLYSKDSLPSHYTFLVHTLILAPFVRLDLKRSSYFWCFHRKPVCILLLTNACNMPRLSPTFCLIT